MMPRRLFALEKIVPILFLSIGIIVLMQVIMPLVSFGLWDIGQQINNKALVSPKKERSSILGVSVQNKGNFPLFFSKNRRETQPNYSQFQLTVPKLGLDQEIVNVDSNDLTAGLAHLPGTGLPGERGNVFISGHSAINRAISIQKAPFAKLTDLKEGDEITIDAGNSRFLYKVVGIKVVDPSDLSVIPPPEPQGRYVTLMTCVPPGLNFRRLIVLGKMV